MTLNPTPDELVKLTKEFFASVREYFVANEGGGDQELQVERLFAAFAAATGAALVVWPFRTERHKEAAGALFATAVRLWSRQQPELPPRSSWGRGSGSAGSAARSSFSSSPSRFSASAYGVTRDFEDDEDGEFER